MSLPCCAISEQPLSNPKIVIDEEGKRVICIAKIDYKIIQRAMIRHACFWSFVPIYGCCGLQPFRALCWASQESKLQAAAVHLILYESHLQLDVDSYPMFCTCSGSGPPPNPYNEFAFCSSMPATTVVIKLRNILDFSIENYMGCKRLHISGKANGEPMSMAVLGIENLDEFLELLSVYVKKCKEMRRNGRNALTTIDTNNIFPNSNTVESCLNSYTLSLSFSTSNIIRRNDDHIRGKIDEEEINDQKNTTSKISPIAI